MDGYGHAGFQGYSDGMHVDGMTLDQEMVEDFGPGMGYNQMPRHYNDF